MKKYILLAAVLLASCQQEYVIPIDFNVTLDPANTYLAGDPVRFNISGNAQNITFFSGERTHEYKNKDRYSVPLDEVESAILTVRYQARYGYPDALHVYASSSFPGLKGNDFKADSTTLVEMEAAMDKETLAIPGWELLPYDEGASTFWTEQSYDLTPYLNNFVIAFHWTPRLTTSAQRSYWINGTIDLEFKNDPSSSVTFSELAWVGCMLNPEYSDPAKVSPDIKAGAQDPYTTSGNPGFDLTRSATQGMVSINGCNGSAKVPYVHYGWMVSKPTALNKVANDTGIVLKNLQNDLDSFQYTFTEPGVYKVAFIGNNHTIGGHSRDVREITVNIISNTVL